MDVLRLHAGVGSECDRTTPRGFLVQIHHPSERQRPRPPMGSIDDDDSAAW
jgi:hypothetical protein